MTGGRQLVAAALTVALGLAGRLLAAEVYGKPLKGLSAVPVASAVANPEKYAGKAIRVAGVNAGEKGRPALRDGDAVLPVVADGFDLPEDLGTVRLTAEGRLRREKDAVVFVATGVEVRR